MRIPYVTIESSQHPQITEEKRAEKNYERYISFHLKDNKRLP